MMEAVTKIIAPKAEDTTVEVVMQRAQVAFSNYKKLSPEIRAAFLECIADEIENARPSLVAVANAETNLPEARLNGELSRTTGQLRKFAALIREGSWVEASIDTGDSSLTPAKPDVRKCWCRLGR